MCAFVNEWLDYESLCDWMQQAFMVPLSAFCMLSELVAVQILLSGGCRTCIGNDGSPIYQTVPVTGQSIRFWPN